MRPTTILYITADEQRVAQCRGMDDDGRRRWRLDSGKPIRVYLPPVKPDFCDGNWCWEISEPENANLHIPSHYRKSVPSFICEHTVDAD